MPVAVPRTRAEAAALLGVDHGAGDAAVNDRYRKLALVYHPDHNPEDEAAGQRMQELNVARDLLLGDRAEGAADAPATGDEALPPAERKRAERVKAALHTLPYGVYVIGTVSGEGATNVMVADWIMQVSFRPRMIAVAFEGDATSLKNVRATRRLTVNLLPQEGMDLAARFLQPSDPSKVKGRRAETASGRVDKLSGVDHRLSDGGCPLLAEAISWLDCEAEQFIAVGDHVLVLARALDGALERDDLNPLTSLYTGWVYSG